MQRAPARPGWCDGPCATLRARAPVPSMPLPGAAHKKGPRAKPGPVRIPQVVIHYRRVWWGCQARRSGWRLLYRDLGPGDSLSGAAPGKRESRPGSRGIIPLRWSPSLRMPVPASSTSIVPSFPRTSTVDVFPPYRTVSGHGAAIDPRVPKSVTRIIQRVPRRGPQRRENRLEAR